MGEIMMSFFYINIMKFYIRVAMNTNINLRKKASSEQVKKSNHFVKNENE